MIPFSILIFYTSDGHVLLQNRTSITIDSSEWGFFGGIHNPGEHPEAALCREIKEELDYDLSDFEHVSSFMHEFSSSKFHGHVFAAQLPENHTTVMRVLEGDGMGLHHISTLDSLRFAKLHSIQTLPIIKEFLKKKL